VTLALATWRGFPWRKVPGCIIAQVLGALVGAAIVYGNYFHAIDIVEGGRRIRTLKTAGLFGTYAVRRSSCHQISGDDSLNFLVFQVDYMTSVSCFFSEVLGRRYPE
jgi:aquaglyceroporin related protein